MSSMITNEQGLIHLYACKNSLKIRNTNFDVYGDEFFNKLKCGFIKFIANDSQTTIHNLWRKNMCVYCLESIDNIKFSQGDHIVPELKKYGIDRYNVPCCKKCNSSKNNVDLIDWLIKNNRTHTDVAHSVINLYVKAKYLLLNINNKLRDIVSDSFNVFLKQLDEDIEIENLIKYDSTKKHFFHQVQLDTFHFLQTEPIDWNDCKIIGKTEINDVDHPLYRVSGGFAEVTPFDDRNPMKVINSYGFDDMNGELPYTHRDNCQLCGTPILVNYRIRCDRLSYEMVVGSECIKSYHKLKGDEYAISGKEKIKEFDRDLFVKKILEFKFETVRTLNHTTRFSKKVFSKKYDNYVSLFHKNEYYVFKQQLNKINSNSSKKTIVGLIRKAKSYNISVNDGLMKIVSRMMKRVEDKESQKSSLYKLCLDIFNSGSFFGTDATFTHLRDCGYNDDDFELLTDNEIKKIIKKSIKEDGE